jgi:hypothetical protein
MPQIYEQAVDPKTLPTAPRPVAEGGTAGADAAGAVAGDSTKAAAAVAAETGVGAEPAAYDDSRWRQIEKWSADFIQFQRSELSSLVCTEPCALHHSRRCH